MRRLYSAAPRPAWGMRALAGRGDRVRERVAAFSAAGGAWYVAGIQLGLSHSALEYLCDESLLKTENSPCYYTEELRCYTTVDHRIVFAV